MNTIPSELIAVPGYHGYFWHPTEQVVYSIKVDGILKPLAKTRGWSHPKFGWLAPGFQLSRRGRKRHVSIDFLKKLTPTDYQVPYVETRSRF